MTTAREAKYLAGPTLGAKIHSVDTACEPIIDGRAYFAQLWQELQRPSLATDAIYVVGWQLDDGMVLVDPPPAAAPRTIGELLVQKADAGVDVRVVLSGGIYLSSFKQTPFAINLRSAERLRTAAVGAKTPLADRVLFDYTGQLLGSHHQKVTVIKVGNQLQAFIGGLDYWPSRLDAAPHDTHPWADGSPWGWHDIGARLEGPGAADAWENFRERWLNTLVLPADTYRRGFTTGIPFNPVVPAPGMKPAPTTIDPPPARADGAGQPSVQVLRSRYPWLLQKIIGANVPWFTTPGGGLVEVFRTLEKAIDAAQTYVYAEDQFLANSLAPFAVIPGGFDLFPAFERAAARGVKVIFLGSDKGDPDDIPYATRKNQALTSELSGMVNRLGANGHNIVVWRVANTTVHAKSIVIDDEFAAIGSANLHTRSMFGVDSELHVAFVHDGGDAVLDYRMALWAEHLRADRTVATVEAALRDLPMALGIWRPQWLPTGTDPGTWRGSNLPPGYAPTNPVLALVGPPW